MFCSECGAKNELTDVFCGECGAKLVHEEINNINSNSNKPKKPMSKKNKIIITVVAAIIVILGIGYKVGSDMTGPKGVAKDYFEAMINNDSDAVYKYLDLDGDKTFISKKVFKKLMEDEVDSDVSKIQNYKVTDVTYSDDKLTAKVKIVYTVEGSTSEKSETVNLTKRQDKKFFIFDNWTISDLSASSMIVEDYEITVDKGAKITYFGVKVADKYLDQDESTETKDVYLLPQVFMTSTDVVVELSNGIKLEKTVIPTSYTSSKTITFDEDNLSTDEQTEVKTKGKEVLTNLYSSAIENKKFSEIKSVYEHKGLDLTNLETNYDEFVSRLSNARNKLTSFEVATITLRDASLTKDGDIEVEYKIKYNYTVSNTSTTGEETTYSDSEYDYMTVVFSYEKGDFYPLDFKNFETYFSNN